MHELKIYRGVIWHDNEKRWKIGRGIDLLFQNWHEDFDKFWPEHLKISNICTLMACLWPKYIMFELKTYRRVMFDGTEYWCKIWRKTGFCFQKWHEEFGKFSPEHLKVSTFEVWWNSFIQIRLCLSLKFTAELFVTATKEQNWKRNWLVISKLIWVLCWVLTQALENLKNLQFNGLPLTKLSNVWVKKYRRVMFDGTEHWHKIWRKTDFCFHKWYEEFGKFSPEHLKVSKLEFWWDSFI